MWLECRPEICTEMLLLGRVIVLLLWSSTRYTVAQVDSVVGEICAERITAVRYCSQMWAGHVGFISLKILFLRRQCSALRNSELSQHETLLCCCTWIITQAEVAKEDFTFQSCTVWGVWKLLISCWLFASRGLGYSLCLVGSIQWLSEFLLITVTCPMD